MIEFGITPNQIFKNLTSSRFDFDELEKNKRFQITNFELEKEFFSFSNIDYLNKNFNKNENFQYIKIIEFFNKIKLYLITLNNVYSFDINRKKEKKDNNFYYLYSLENQVNYTLIQNKCRIQFSNNKKIPIVIFGKGEFIVIGGSYNGNINSEN